MPVFAESIGTPRAASSPTGSDLRGWSALPLLGAAGRLAAPWLFVTGRSRAWVSRGPLADARFDEMVADYRHPWPFGDGSLAGVVIDGDAVGRGAAVESLRRVLAEARRAAGPQGSVLVVCGHRLVPRRLRAWREYGRRSDDRWKRAAATLDASASTAALLELDGDRVTEITMGQPAPHAARRADRAVLRVAADGRTAEALDALIVHASRGCGTELRIDRLAVRKIGKTAVFLSGADGRQFIMRIARSPVALARAERNFETLAWMRRSPLTDGIRSRVPEAVVRGTHAGYSYFVETRRPGRAVAPRGGWTTAAAEFIIALHASTRQPAVMNGAAMSRLVYEPLGRIAAYGDRRTATVVLARVRAACDTALAGQVLPIVRTHGDFTEANCLFDARGGLTAVVDWEVSQERGLPLMDLLQLMPVPGETGTHPRWQRFDAWCELLREPDRAVADPVMGSYLRTVGVTADAVRGLALMQWITHIADRIAARHDDERWMNLRVLQPLESLGKVLRD